MEALEAILSRRSIRRYTAGAISEKTVTELLAAAMSAPSAGNQQPWQFVVVRDRQLIDQIPDIHPYATMLREAALAILVCGDLDLEKHAGYWVQDCSAATQNLLLAAHASGLGAVWCGVHPREDRVVGLRKLLGLPEHIVPMALISIGQPAESKPPSHRYDPARVHYDGW
jgi:nitroreductase